MLYPIELRVQLKSVESNQFSETMGDGKGGLWAGAVLCGKMLAEAAGERENAAIQQEAVGGRWLKPNSDFGGRSANYGRILGPCGGAGVLLLFPMRLAD